MMADLNDAAQINEVRISFGQHLIFEHLDDPMSTTDFEPAMHQYFASLRTSSRSATAAVSPDARNS